MGNDIAGVDSIANADLASLRPEMSRLGVDHAQARHVADTAESMRKIEQVAVGRTALQLR